MNSIKSSSLSSFFCPNCHFEITKDQIIKNAGNTQVCIKCKKNIPLSLIFSFLDSRFDKAKNQNRSDEIKSESETTCDKCKRNPAYNKLYCCEKSVCTQCLPSWLKNDCTNKDDGLNSLLCSFCSRELSMKLLKHLSYITISCDFCKQRDNSKDLQRLNCCRKFSCYECFKNLLAKFHDSSDKILKCYCQEEIVNETLEAFSVPNKFEEVLLSALNINEKIEEINKEKNKERQLFYSKKTNKFLNLYTLFCEKCGMSKLEKQFKKKDCTKKEKEHGSHSYCKSCIKYLGIECDL